MNGLFLRDSVEENGAVETEQYFFRSEAFGANAALRFEKCIREAVTIKTSVENNVDDKTMLRNHAHILSGLIKTIVLSGLLRFGPFEKALLFDDKTLMGSLPD